MFDFLRDPIWQFAGFAIGVIGVLVGVWASLRGRSKKITYEIISQTPLLNFDIKTTTPKAKLIVGKKTIENAELVLVKIINIGSKPIRSDDYEVPLTIQTGQLSNILDVKIVETNPEKLGVHIEDVKENEIVFKNALLNSGDWFVTQIIVIPEAIIDVHGRIVGIKEIRGNAHKSYSTRVMTTVFIWSVIVIIAYFILTGFTDYSGLLIGLSSAFAVFTGGVILPRLMDWIRDAQ